MPIACLLNGEEDKNYARVKEALQSLQRKIFEYEDDEIWQSISIIALPYIRKRSSVLSFQVHPRVWDCILDFSKGYRKYELKAAMSFKSQFSMRFYELLSNQKSPLTYSVIQLKEMFCVADKYERINDFIRYVVEAAKKELDEVSPYTFEYTPVKSGRKITAIKFYPVYQPEHRDSDLEKHDLQKQISLSWSLSSEVRNYLKSSIGYSDKEIKNNLDLFISAQNILPDLMGELALLKGKARDKKNPKGYIINSIKGKLNDKK
jgi:plasmid replication initiation protein